MTETTLETSARTRADEKYVYFFGEGKAEGSGTMRDVLGGKGAGLHEMTNIGVPVPPGFTIVTDVCRWYHDHGRTLPPEFEPQEREALARLERVMEKTLGASDDPLLVSVRSGAKFSMPGMMDTVLNLGLNDRSVLGLAERTRDARFAWDCYGAYSNVRLGRARPRSPSSSTPSTRSGSVAGTPTRTSRPRISGAWWTSSSPWCAAAPARLPAGRARAAGARP
jgi:hypothetical protein